MPRWCRSIRSTDQLYILNATGNKIEIVQISAAGALDQDRRDRPRRRSPSSARPIRSPSRTASWRSPTATHRRRQRLRGAVQRRPARCKEHRSRSACCRTCSPSRRTAAKILVANEAEAMSTANNAERHHQHHRPVGRRRIGQRANHRSASPRSTAARRLLDGTLGLSLFPGQSAAADIEPEYISVSPDGTRAYVTLQEVNAVAVIDLTNPAATAPLAILPLGSIDRSLAGNAVRWIGSGRHRTAGTINIQNWPVRSLLQPDAIATFAVDGVTYFVTANEGDARVGTGLTGEEVRLSSGGYNLDNTVFPNEAALKNNDESRPPQRHQSRGRHRRRRRYRRDHHLRRPRHLDLQAERRRLDREGARDRRRVRADPCAAAEREFLLQQRERVRHASTPAPTTRARSPRASTSA